VASYDPRSKLSTLNPNLINEILQFASDTSALSEAKKKAVHDSVEKGLKKTKTYKKYLKLINQKLAEAKDSPQPRESSLASGLRAEVMEYQRLLS